MKTVFQKVIFATMALGMLLAAPSCKKTVRGCMDKTASNYNPLASESCSSCCIYAMDTLPPSYGNVLFYSSETSTNVTLASGKVITASSNTDCTGPASGNRVSLSQGTYTYIASNTSGMNWSGTFTVTTGECNTVSLSASNAITGKIAFLTDNTGLGNITVTLDNNPAGNIGSYVYSPTFPGPGFDVVVAPGTHSYAASSANGQTWSGTVTVSSSNMVSVLFERGDMAPVASGYCNIVFFSRVEPDYTVHFNNADLGSGITYTPNAVPLSAQNWVVSTVVPFGTYGWWATTSAGKYFSGTVATDGKSLVAVQIN